jgi:hypothetical protein
MIKSRDGAGQRLVACSTVRKQEQRYDPIIFSNTRLEILLFNISRIS